MDQAVEQQKKRGKSITTIFFIISGVITASWASRIPDMQSSLSLGNADWGTVLFASPAGLVSGLFVASWLNAHFGVKKILILSAVCSSVILIFAGFSNEKIQLMVILFLLGFSRTVMNISANTLSLQVQKLYRKPIISTFHGIWSLTCFVAAGFGTLMIILNMQPGHHFLIVSLVCLFVSLAFINRPFGQAMEKVERKPLIVIPDKYLFVLGLIAFCGMISENTMFDWSVNYFDKVVQAGKGFITTGYTCFILSMTLGRLFGDRFIFRYGAVKMLAVNGILLAVGFLLSALAPFLLTASIGFIIIGIGDSLIVPVVYTLSGKTNKMSPGYAIAAVTIIGYLGFLTGPLLVGYLSEWLDMQWAFAFIGIFGLCIFMLSFQLKKFREEQPGKL